MSRAQKIWVIGLFISSLGTAFTSGYFFRAAFYPEKHQFSLLEQAFRIFIEHEYYELPEKKILEYGMIRGMLQAGGDPNAFLLEPVQQELESDALQGDYGGIGVEISRDHEGQVWLHPITNSPAARAGIQDGDRLLAIEGTPVTMQMTLEEIEAALRGPVGERLNLRIARPPGLIPQEFKIVREKFDLPSVTWYSYPRAPQVAVVRVNLIAASTRSEIETAFNQSISEGASHYVLDLRDNGGGLLTAGIDIARLFLRQGIVIQQQYRGRGVESFHVDEPGLFSEVPLVVLVNRGTASAAEIVAGALKAHNRATVIGETTFGKNSIQLVFDLEDGSSLHITAAEWWIPGMEGEADAGGIQPDIILTADQLNSDAAVQTAVESLLGN
jgi:carboxyl-terminal processing protease